MMLIFSRNTLQESYSPDDNREPIPLSYDRTELTEILGFDLRPFLYPSRFPWQFKKIDEVAAALPDRSKVDHTTDKTKTE
jgi:NAD+ synthase (glutamine-hydrolysing)